MKRPAATARPTRAARSNPPNRYQATRHEALDDGWWQDAPAPLRTQVGIDQARRAITQNDSPDIPFDRALNPYRGCEHGCIYCYARPTHAWLDLSPGLDFETRLFVRPSLAERLREELAAPGYRPAPLAISSATDAYQPLERQHALTRAVLEVLIEARHPFTITTKSALIERDLDLITQAAELRLTEVAISITTLDDRLAQRLEPRAAPPRRRLLTIKRLTQAGIAVRLLAAPLIPVLADHELERIMAAARSAGAQSASYTMLRLPRELAGLFNDWLREHAPDAAEHVMNRLRANQGGRENDTRFGRRMRGSGVYADLIAQRFRLAAQRLGFSEPPPLRCDLFRPPGIGGQLSLF